MLRKKVVRAKVTNTEYQLLKDLAALQEETISGWIRNKIKLDADKLQQNMNNIHKNKFENEKSK
jgi:hypothetical protein